LILIVKSGVRMLKMLKKAQASMTFLMNYSRAILVIFAALAVMTHMGAFTTGYAVADSCTMSEGLGCLDKVVSQTAVQMLLINGMGETITIHNITADQCTGATGGVLRDAQQQSFVVNGCNLVVGEKYSGAVNITFSGGSGLLKTKAGYVVAKVE
jgi:hypothetical protein